MGIKFIIQPWFNDLVDVLWKNKSRIIKELDKYFSHRIVIINDSEEFLDIPKEIIKQFPHLDILLILHEIVPELLKTSKTKTVFGRSLAEKLTNSIVSVK